jgi:hypothetical protein
MHERLQNFRRQKWSKHSKSPFGKRFLSNCCPQLSQKRSGVGFLWFNIRLGRDERSAIASAGLAGLRLERWHDLRWTAPSVSRHATFETHRDLATCVGMAAVVLHRAQRRSEWASVGSVVLRGERRRDEWSAASGAIFAGVTAVAPQSVGHERFALTIHPSTASLCIQAHGHERSGTVEVVAPATLSSAAAKSAGNFFFRFAARRRIPAQALGLKKYRGAIRPVSRIPESEDTTAPLRNSEELRIQNAPFE